MGNMKFIIGTFVWLFFLNRVSSGLRVKNSGYQDVVKKDECTKSTCKIKGKVIICCHLQALNNLVQVQGIGTILPDNVRLHIVKIRERALCTGADAILDIKENNTDLCKTAKYKITPLKWNVLNKVSGLSISKTQLEYISESFFSLFPRVKHIVIDKNPNLKEIPAVNRSPKNLLKTLSYIGNPDVQIVKWEEKNQMPSLKEFLFSNFLVKAGSPTKDFYMGTFTPGKNLKAFKIRLNYLTAFVSMPTMKKTTKLSEFYIGSTNIPDNLRINYTNFEASIQQSIFNFPVKPDHIVPDFLPSDFIERFDKVDLRFDGEKYDLKNLEFRRKIPTNRLLLPSPSEDQSLFEVKREYGAPKNNKDSKGRYIVKYFLLDTNELTRLVKDSHNKDKTYIVHADFLWIHDINYLRKSVKLHLTFNSLIISEGGLLFSADTKTANETSSKNKNFNVAKSVNFLDKDFDTKAFIDYLITAASLSEGISYGDSSSNGDDMKRKLASLMLLGIKEKDILDVAAASALPVNEIIFIEDAMLRLHKLVAFTKRPLGKIKQVADVTIDEYRQKTLMYQELAKTLITSERYQNSNKRMTSGLKLLTETLKLRLDVLSGHAALKIERDVEEEKQRRSSHKKLKSLSTKYLNAIMPIKQQFFKALQSQKLSAKYSGTLQQLNNLFETLFTDTKNNTKRKLISRPKLLSDLDIAVKRVSNFTISLDSIQSLIAEKYISKESNSEPSDVASAQESNTYFRERLANLNENKGISDDDAILVTSKMYDANIDDIFQWDTIMQRVDKLLDLALSTEVPQTLAFKTMLLRLMDAAKVETEMLYDVTSAQANIFLGNYTINSLQRQNNFLSNQLNDITENPEQRSIIPLKKQEIEDIEDKFLELRQFTILQLKLDMLTHISDMCTFIEYSTSTACLYNDAFGIDASLPNILYLTDELLVASQHNAIAPQSFNNIPIRYELNEYCDQMLQAVNNAYIQTTTLWQPQIQQPVAKTVRPSVQPLRPSFTTINQAKRNSSMITIHKHQRRHKKRMKKTKIVAKTLIRSSQPVGDLMENNATKKTNVSRPAEEGATESHVTNASAAISNGTSVDTEATNASLVNQSRLIYDVDDSDVMLNKDTANQTTKENEQASFHEDLLSRWIDERLGIKKVITENSVKRSHLSAKNHYREPIRTLDGIRVRRTTESSSKRITQKDYSKYESEIFNDAISGYMKRSLVGSREQFESLFRKCNASKVFELKENKMVTLTITPKNKQFKGFERVRVEEVKVYLHGAATTNGMIEINIKSERLMHDRFGGKKTVYIGKPWDRNFRYNLQDVNKTLESQMISEIKADIHERQNTNAFYPTPFTTWIISVSSERNPGLDLSKLTSIEMLFSGSLLTSATSEPTNELDFFQTLKAKALFRPISVPSPKPSKKKNKHPKRRTKTSRAKRKNLKITNRKMKEKKIIQKIETKLNVNKRFQGRQSNNFHSRQPNYLQARQPIHFQARQPTNTPVPLRKAIITWVG